MPLPGQRPAEIVSVGFDDHPALATHLQSVLQKAVEDKIQALVSAKDWPDYEKRRGEINGLNLAIDLCRQTELKLQG